MTFLRFDGHRFRLKPPECVLCLTEVPEKSGEGQKLYYDIEVACEFRGNVLTKQFQHPFSEQFQKILAISSDEQIRRLLAGHISKILPSAHIDLMALEDGIDVNGVDLILLAHNHETDGSRNWLARQSTEHMPPVISIDFAATVAAAVDTIRLGALDYIDGNEMDESRLVSALTLAANSSQMITDAAADRLASEASEQTQELTFEQTQKISQAPTAALDQTVMPDTAQADKPEAALITQQMAYTDNTREAPHINSAPQTEQDVAGDTPFAGDWLRLPDIITKQAWPFSAAEMVAGKAMLGHYRIQEFLGAGGMASVFKALRVSDNKLFAIKLLNPAMADESSRERFVREFNILKAIRHKHVVQMEQQADDNGWVYTVMEYLSSGDLKSRIRQNLERGKAVYYAAQIAAALQAAHNLGVLHRDIKPTNVLFRSKDSLALVDFGVAKGTRGNRDEGVKAAENLTKEGLMVGTPYYISPEQAMGEKTDRRSDLYALGVLLFEMLEGRRPFVGDSLTEILMSHVNDPIPSLSQEWDGLNDVLAQLLAKKPADRFNSGFEVLRALNNNSPGDVPAYLFAG